MNIFQTFLHATNKGSYKPNSIYVGDIRRIYQVAPRDQAEQRCDALMPILKACAYAAELKMIDHTVNARIQDMRITPKMSLADEESEFDGKYLTKEQMSALLEYYHICSESRRKEFLEIFFFAFHTYGLRVVDVMTLQWSHINFERKELRKIMIKTNKRHVIPLTEPALRILRQWQEKREGCRWRYSLKRCKRLSSTSLPMRISISSIRLLLYFRQWLPLSAIPVRYRSRVTGGQVPPSI